MNLYRSILSFCILVLFFHTSFSQSVGEKIKNLEQEITNILQMQDSLLGVVENLKLEELRMDLEQYGLPKIEDGEELIKHQAMYLVYSEEHKQAKWVAHIIRPEILSGSVSRTNDFRPDSLVRSGTAIEQDYFLKTKQADGSFEYDGYGFDRGHLAPSADFRWSQTALSQSYYYSNISPQKPEFNQEGWAELESALRSYIYQNPKSQLFIVTGPVLSSKLKKVERSVNKVSLPEFYFKVALDLEKKNGIGFIMPNEKLNQAFESYAVSIDSVESFTGLDFFHTLDDELEGQIEREYDLQLWLPESIKGDLQQISKADLPEGAINTSEAKIHIISGKEVLVCGTAVSTHKSRNGNVFINLDKQFPNQIFSATIWERNASNFGYAPEKYLLNKKICLRGTVKDNQGVPTMNIENDHQIVLLDSMN